MRYFLLIFALGVVTVMGVFGKRGHFFKKPPLEIFPDMDRQPKLRPHASANCAGNFGRRPEQMGAARNVGKGLVNGNPFHERREIADHLDGGVAQPLVFLEMPADKDELRTEFGRLPSRHAAADSEGLGFVRSGKHNPTTDGNRFAAQRWIEQLLD